MNSSLTTILLLSLVAISMADTFDDLQSDVFDLSGSNNLGSIINSLSSGYVYNMPTEEFKDWAAEARKFKEDFDEWLDREDNNYYRQQRRTSKLLTKVLALGRFPFKVLSEVAADVSSPLEDQYVVLKNFADFSLKRKSRARKDLGTIAA